MAKFLDEMSCVALRPPSDEESVSFLYVMYLPYPSTIQILNVYSFS